MGPPRRSSKGRALLLAVLVIAAALSSAAAQPTPQGPTKGAATAPAPAGAAAAPKATAEGKPAAPSKLGWEGAVTIVVISLGLIVMMLDWLEPHLTFTLMVAVLLAARIIDTKAGASGFSNTGVLTVVVLYAVAEGVSQTGGLDLVMSRVLGKSKTSPRAALVRMMLPVAVASAFLNNTPIVALMIPILVSWGRRANVSPKVLLLPLSYASIFGGTTTLIGTSTNLVISGLQSKRYAGTPNANFGFFDISPYGLPYGVWGFVYVLLIGIYLLPRDTGSRPKEDLLLSAEVEPSSAVAGKALADSGLLELSAVRLLTVVRGGELAYQAPEPPLHGFARLAQFVRRRVLRRGGGPLPSPRGANGGSSRGSSGGADGMVTLGSEAAAAAAAPGGALVLAPGDLLHFQGDLKQLQGHCERLGLSLTTSNQDPLDDVLQAAAAGHLSLQQVPPSQGAAPAARAPAPPAPAPAPVPAPGAASEPPRPAAARDGDQDDSPAPTLGRVAATAQLFGGLGPLASRVDAFGAPRVVPRQPSLVPKPSGPSRRASLGWSGASMWLFRAHVKKDASVIGRELGAINWWQEYGVVVIGAELKGHGAATLSQLVLQRGDLLVFTARNDFNYRTSDFAANFERVEFLQDDSTPKTFLLPMRVKGGRGGAAGRDLATAGLQDINGLHIAAVTRPETGERFEDAPRTFVLQEGDVLWFATDVDGVRYMLKDLRLDATESGQAAKLRGRLIYRTLVQATVSPNSALIGHSARQIRLRTYYNAALLAVYRQSGHVELRSPADVKLDAGDVLLLEADIGFAKKYSACPAFGIISAVPSSAPLKRKLMWPAVVLAAAMVVTQVVAGFTGDSYIDLWPAAMLTAAAMLLIGCMSSDQAVGAIDWTVYITVAFAFGVSAAMEKTGVAHAIASVFVSISKAIGGQTAALGSMYLVTGLLSEVLTNNASAALMYPIAASVGDDMGIRPNVMSIAVMLGASAAFISPFGYQCNLMVFTAGQYRTIDFVKVGTLLQVWQLVGACVILSMPNHWQILNGASVAVLAASIGYAALSSWLTKRREAAKLKGGEGKPVKGDGGGPGDAKAPPVAELV